MKRIPIKPRCKIALLAGAILTLSLISCTRQSSVLEENALQTAVSEESLRNTNVQLTESESEEQTTEEAGTTLTYTYTQPAETIPLATKIQLDKNTLSYGKLQITLPDGVTIEEQKPENDMCVIDLIDMEKKKKGPFPPRIWLLHYRITYQDKWELASALLDILPDITLHSYDKPGDNLHYLFTYDKPYKNGYIMAYENDICIVEEISSESSYSFGQLLENDMVHWEDSIQKLDIRRDNIDYVNLNKIKVEKDCTLLAMQSVDEDVTREISLFRDGCFAAPMMKFSFAKCYSNIQFEDYNFDGCLDMIVSGTKIYLWNADKKTYEAAQIPNDYWFGSRESYPETQTIWGDGKEFVNSSEKEASWDIYDYTETLWKWEKTALVKRRECVAEVREETVRICAYDEELQNMMFDETFTTEEWEQNSACVQKRYQQFYAGMVPEERSKNLRKINNNQEHPKYIPQALLDKIKKAMLDGTVSKIFEELRIDKKLTEEKILTLAKDDLEMRSDVAGAKQYGDYSMVMADGDNDGVMDLIGENGGYYDSGDITGYIFYQGQKDGTYQKTQGSNFIMKQFAILSYDGKNYLCYIFYGYAGIENMCLEYFVEGITSEKINLVFFPEKYELRLAECAEEKYKTLAEDVLQNAISYREKLMKDSIIGGSEEKASSEQYEYKSDLNNDGVLEQYNKSIWPRGLEYLEFSGEGTGIEQIYEIEQSIEGRAVMLWVDPFAGENIINVISKTEWEDFEITGFLINGTEYKKLYRITANAVRGVREEWFGAGSSVDAFPRRI